VVAAWSVLSVAKSFSIVQLAGNLVCCNVWTVSVHSEWLIDGRQDGTADGQGHGQGHCLGPAEAITDVAKRQLSHDGTNERSGLDGGRGARRDVFGLGVDVLGHAKRQGDDGQIVCR